MKMMLLQEHKPKPPSFISINVNEECFFKCKMCFKWQQDIMNSKGAKRLTSNEIKKFIDELRQLTNEKLIINFAGGEPFLRKDFLEIIKFSADKGFKPYVSSNAWLINEQKAKEIAISGLQGIVFSVDGATAKTHDKMRGHPGSFDQVIKAIDMLHKFRQPNNELHIAIQTVLCALNYHEALDMINWVDNSKTIEVIHFNAVTEPNNTKHDPEWYKKRFSYLWPEDPEKICDVIDQIIEKKKKGSHIVQTIPQLKAYKNYFRFPKKFVKKNVCHFDKSLSLSSVGDFFMCYEYKRIGSIRKNSLIKAWNSFSANGIRKQIRKCKKNCHVVINCNFEE